MTAAHRTMTSLQVRANNLANANTPGFRADLEQSQAVDVKGYGYDSRHMARIKDNGVDLTPGPITATGRDLDFAIQGHGMIALQGAEGEVYTRHGSMQVDAEQRLTVGGRPVLGDGGTIVLPEYDSIHIGTDGVVSVRPRGESLMTQIDTIKRVDIPASELRKDATGMLVTKSGRAAEASEGVSLVSRQLEMSNVSAIEELVATTSLSRLFETQVKMMKAAEDLSQAGNRLIRGS